MRGGARPGAGRPRKSAALHAIEGTWRKSRHGPRPATAAVLLMPGPVEDWQPSEADLRELTPRGRDWLHATLAVYRLNGLEGLRVMEACRVLSRVEVLESEPGMTTAAALARERRLFVSMWDALRLEK